VGGNECIANLCHFVSVVTPTNCATDGCTNSLVVAGELKSSFLTVEEIEAELMWKRQYSD
jgi:hypothetical protein